MTILQYLTAAMGSRFLGSLRRMPWIREPHSGLREGGREKLPSRIAAFRLATVGALGSGGRDRVM